MWHKRNRFSESFRKGKRSFRFGVCTLYSNKRILNFEWFTWYFCMRLKQWVCAMLWCLRHIIHCSRIHKPHNFPSFFRWKIGWRWIGWIKWMHKALEFIKLAFVKVDGNCIFDGKASCGFGHIQLIHHPENIPTFSLATANWGKYNPLFANFRFFLKKFRYESCFFIWNFDTHRAYEPLMLDYSLSPLHNYITNVQLLCM